MSTKQVIVMRNDLGMRKGKMIAQGAHASLAFMSRRVQASMEKKTFNLARYVRLSDFVELSEAEKEWIQSSFAKVCVRVDSLGELWEIQLKAEEAGLEVHLITDSGKTEFHGEPTPTCLAIGPDYSENIDPITGHLKLL